MKILNISRTGYYAEMLNVVVKKYLATSIVKIRK